MPCIDTTHHQDHQYTLLDNGIHRFAFKTTARAIDEHFEVMTELIKTFQPNSTVRMLFVAGNITRFPKPHFMRQALSFWQQHRRMDVHLRSAYLVEDQRFIRFLATLVNTLRLNSERIILTMDQEAEAIAWLLSDDSPTDPDTDTP